MTTTTERPTTTRPASVRPAWVDDAVLARLLRRVSRDPEGTADPIVGVAPYDGRPVAEVPASTQDDVAAAVSSARIAQRAWAVLPYSSRAEVVLRFHDLLIEHQDEVLDLIQWEMG